MTTLFEMVKEVLDDSREKLAEEHSSEEETTSKKKDKPSEKEEVKAKAETSEGEAEKVAQWCDYLAENLHTVVDDRSPQEKLAEYATIQEYLFKQGESHALDSGIGPGGPASAMKTEEADASGTSLDAGESGQATSGKIPPKVVEPNEKPTDASAANALETNLESKVAHIVNLFNGGYLTEEAAEDLLSKEAGTPMDFARLLKANPNSKELDTIHSQWIAGGKSIKSMSFGDQVLAIKALRSGQGQKVASVRQEQLAQAMINKFAADAENPASISAGETPLLQSAVGANSAQMQGTEAGEQVPSEMGSDAGRELISSNESAQDATKQQAKTRTVKSDMGGLLAEPVMSASHDQVLNKSLENASSAGVKIAATRELLKQWAESSPENQAKLAYAIKLAQPPMAPPGAPPMGSPGIPPPGATPQVEAGMPTVSDEALAAAAEGVTPEEVATAQAILGSQGVASAAPQMAPPEAEGAVPTA